MVPPVGPRVLATVVPDAQPIARAVESATRATTAAVTVAREVRSPPALTTPALPGGVTTAGPESLGFEARRLRAPAQQRPRQSPYADPAGPVFAHPPSEYFRRARLALTASKKLEHVTLESDPRRVFAEANLQRALAAVWLDWAVAAKAAREGLPERFIASRLEHAAALRPWMTQLRNQLTRPVRDDSAAFAAAVIGERALDPAPAAIRAGRSEVRAIRGSPETGLVPYELGSSAFSRAALRAQDAMRILARAQSSEISSPVGVMIRGRSLEEYLRRLGPTFERELRALSEGGVWLDSGGGQFAAASDFLAQQGAGWPARKPKVLGVDLDASDGARALAAREPERFQFHEGNAAATPFADGSVDLISDLYAGASYAFQPSEVVAEYGRLLKPGGKMVLYFREGYDETKNVIVDAAGKAHPFADWLDSIKGLRLEAVERTGTGKTFSFVLERTDDPLQVPAAHTVGLRKASDLPLGRLMRSPVEIEPQGQAAALKNTP